MKKKKKNKEKKKKSHTKALQECPGLGRKHAVPFMFYIQTNNINYLTD